MTNDEIILQIAKYIEVGGEPYSGAGNYKRNGEWIPMEECWNLLSPEQKDKRLREAHGAWTAIQGMGVEMVMVQAYESYLAEK